MELRDVLLKRRSVRKFTDEPVTEEQIDFLMHAAMSGPSACNRQPWDFYVTQDPQMLEKLRGVTRFSGMKAPLCIVVCGNLSRALPMQLAEYWIQDCSAAAENILLAAVDCGLGAVWCGLHPQKTGVKKAREALGITEKQVPLCLIWVGHPAREEEPGDHYNEKRVHRI